MSQRMVDVDTTSNGSDKISPEELNKGASVEVKKEDGTIETRQQRKARLASVFSRGATEDRLHVDIPDNLHGEWVPCKDGGVSVHRKQALGFRIDTEFAPKRALHSTEGVGGGSVVGDCVYMVCDKETKEILDEIKHDRYLAVHAPRKGKQKEERDFLDKADVETVPTSESDPRRIALKQNISSALESASKPTG